MSQLWDKIKEFFEYLYEFILDSLFNGLISILSMIPVPQFLTDMTTSAGQISGSALYWMGAFKLGQGISIILSAYLIRFIIRRIPIIG